MTKTVEQVVAEALGIHDDHPDMWDLEARDVVAALREAGMLRDSRPVIDRKALRKEIDRKILWVAENVGLSNDERWQIRDSAVDAVIAHLDAVPPRPVIDREALIDAIAARHWDQDSGEVEDWRELTQAEKENVIDNYLCPRVADAVIAHLDADTTDETEWEYARGLLVGSKMLLVGSELSTEQVVNVRRRKAGEWEEIPNE